MARPHRCWKPPLPGAPSNRGPSMSESVSDAEKAGAPPLPYVEVRPGGPPIEITEAEPLPLPPEPPPFDRATALARLQTAFAGLTDDELEVACLRMLGVPYWDISEETGLLDAEVEKLWKQARRKLGNSMFGAASATPHPTAEPLSAGPGPSTETPQGTGGASPG